MIRKISSCGLSAAIALIAFLSGGASAQTCNCQQIVGTCTATISVTPTGDKPGIYGADLVIRSTATSCSRVDYLIDNTPSMTVLQPGGMGSDRVMGTGKTPFASSRVKVQRCQVCKTADQAQNTPSFDTEGEQIFASAIQDADSFNPTEKDANFETMYQQAGGAQAEAAGNQTVAAMAQVIASPQAATFMAGRGVSGSQIASLQSVASGMSGGSSKDPSGLTIPSISTKGGNKSGSPRCDAAEAQANTELGQLRSQATGGTCAAASSVRAAGQLLLRVADQCRGTPRESEWRTTGQSMIEQAQAAMNSTCVAYTGPATTGSLSTPAYSSGGAPSKSPPPQVGNDRRCPAGVTCGTR